MKRLAMHGIAWENRGLYTAFALCAAIVLGGAAAGCVSGSCADGALIADGISAREATGFWSCAFVNLLAAAAIFICGSSCLGFLLLPPLIFAYGFSAGFIMTALTCAVGWAKAFSLAGWFTVSSLPFFMLLCTTAMRAASAAFKTVVFGIHPEPGVFLIFLKAALICAAASLALAAAQAAVK